MATIGVFLVAVLVIPWLVREAVPQASRYRVAAIHSIQIVMVLVAVAVGSTGGLVAAVDELGLGLRRARTLFVAVVATLPMPVILGFSGARAASLATEVWLVVGVTAPLAEEMVFRGFLFGGLHRRAGWGFWPAALLPAALFGAGHLYQAGDPASAVGVFAVTAFGSVWFSWLYVRWRTLWVPVGIHALMNVWWDVFRVGATASGGWTSNGARLLTVALSVGITLAVGRPTSPPEGGQPRSRADPGARCRPRGS